MRKILFIIIIFFINILIGCGSIRTTNNNSNEKVETIKESMNKNFNQIEIADISSNIVIQNGNEYKVSYQGDEKNQPDVQIKNLKLQIKKRHIFSFNFHFQKNSTVIIELPSTALSRIKIDSSNGNVKIKKLSVRKGAIATSNGDITIDNLKISHGFILSSSNGNIEVNKTNAMGYDLSASNGEVKFNGIYRANELKVNTSSSNVLKIDNSNGNIEIK